MRGSNNRAADNIAKLRTMSMCRKLQHARKEPSGVRPAILFVTSFAMQENKRDFVLIDEPPAGALSQNVRKS